MTVKARIKTLLSEFSEMSVNEMVNKLEVSNQMVHLALKQLQESGEVMKLGSSPKTIYRKTNNTDTLETKGWTSIIDEEETAFLNDNFLIVTDVGDLVEGPKAFEYWCNQRKLPLQKTIKEFILTKKRYAPYYDKAGNINGTDKLNNTKEYDKIWLDKLFYLDFYAIERFGKTKLGTLLHYAKQGQNKFLMQVMMKQVEDRIRKFIAEHEIDAVAFVPPTIRREVQIMKFMEQKLNLNLPHLKIKKISGIIPIPQKSLSKMNERIKNAQNTFSVVDKRNFRHILLIDDAVGSGSTMNQIAEKIRNKHVAEMITGLAIVGSFKGFDVITDV